MNSEKNDQVVTETVLTIDVTITPVEEMMVNEAIGFAPHAETITLLSEQNATAVESPRKATFRNAAVHSETIEAAVEMTVVEEDVTTEEGVTTEEAEIKNNIIEMTGFVLHVRMTISHSELNAINVVNLDQEDNQVVETEEVDTETTVADVVATEEVATETTVADVTVEIVADVVETEEVDSAEDVTVEIVADVVETETVVEEIIAQTNNTERLVESDLVMLIIAHPRKYSLEDISDAMTMTIKVKS